MTPDASRVSLPETEGEFLAKKGPLPIAPKDDRRFQRLHFRNQATLQIASTLPAIPRDDCEWTVYTRDVSRGGIGILAPQQLFPCERAIVRLPPNIVMQIVVTSCRYIAPNCYEIGATFQSIRVPEG